MGSSEVDGTKNLKSLTRLFAICKDLLHQDEILCQHNQCDKSHQAFPPELVLSGKPVVPSQRMLEQELVLRLAPNSDRAKK